MHYVKSTIGTTPSAKLKNGGDDPNYKRYVEIDEFVLS